MSIDFFSFEVDYFSGDTSERSLLTYWLVQRLGAEQCVVQEVQEKCKAYQISNETHPSF